MIKVFVLILFTPLTLCAFAQNNLPPVFEIKADTIDHVKLVDSNWQMLEDKTAKLTIDQVSQPPITNQFHSNTVPAKGVNTYWFRYRLKNTMTQEVEIAISEGLVSYGDIYTKNAKGQWDHKMNGRYVPWSKRDGVKKFMSILYTLQPGEELLIHER